MLLKKFICVVVVMVLRELIAYAIRLTADKVYREGIKSRVMEALKKVRQMIPDDRPRDGRGRFTRSEKEGGDVE